MQTKTAKDFYERDTLRSLAAIARDWVLIILAVILAELSSSWIVYLVAVWFIALMQFSLGEALFHEASHYNLFKSKRLHHFLQFLYAYPVFATLADFQEEHKGHHSFLLKDGDHLFDDYERHGLNKENPNIFWIWFGKALSGYPSVKFLFYDVYIWRVSLFLFWGAVFTGFYLVGALDLLLLYWFVPLLWCFPIYNYWSEIEEHYNTRSGARSNLNPITNWLRHNEGYHWIHHRYPYIPWYNLAKAHKALAPQDSDVSYGFFDTYRQISTPREYLWASHPASRSGPLREPGG